MTGTEIGGALKISSRSAQAFPTEWGTEQRQSGADDERAHGNRETRRGNGCGTEYFMGLSRSGDLIVTCTSMHSRNRRCGIMIGEGLKPEEATKKGRNGGGRDVYHRSRL